MIVIAIPGQRRVVQNSISVKGYPQNNKGDLFEQIETSFEVTAILKGSIPSHFTLLHIHPREPQDDSTCPLPGIDFVLEANTNVPFDYLLFLKKRPDGLYEAGDPSHPEDWIDQPSPDMTSELDKAVEKSSSAPKRLENPSVPEKLHND